MKKIGMFINKIITNKTLLKKLVRYFVVGVLTTGVSFGIFWVMCYIVKTDPNVANIVSIAGAIAFAYVTNKIFVFGSKKETLKELVQEAVSFVLSRGITIVVELGGIFILVTLLKFEPMISKIGISVLVTVLNYVISQFWVFKETPRTDDK